MRLSRNSSSSLRERKPCDLLSNTALSSGETNGAIQYRASCGYWCPTWIYFWELFSQFQPAFFNFALILSFTMPFLLYRAPDKQLLAFAACQVFLSLHGHRPGSLRFADRRDLHTPELSLSYIRSFRSSRQH